jgi:hypothetical protein
MDNGTFGTRHCNHYNTRGERQYTWALYDAQGIYCCRVCDACEEAKAAQYNPVIFAGYTQADVDEPINPEC